MRRAYDIDRPPDNVSNLRLVASTIDEAVTNTPSWRDRLSIENQNEIRKAMIRDLLLACVTDEGVARRNDALLRLQECSGGLINSGRSAVQAVQESWIQ